MLTVYLIDDDATYNSLNKRLISKSVNQDLNIVEFTNPEMALNAILEEGKIPDRVFLDINMPLMDGWEFLEILTEETEHKKINTKISMLTSSLFPEDEAKALNYEYVDNYINKPLDHFTLGKIFN